MRDMDVLIANYQSIIRVLSSQVRDLEAQINNTGCGLTIAECVALDDFFTDKFVCHEYGRDHGLEGLSYILNAWEKIRKGRESND